MEADCSASFAEVVVMAKTKMDLLGIKELGAKEMEGILALTGKMKKDGRKPLLAGTTLAMIFERPSTRTRVSFEVAMAQLGGHSVYLDLGGSQLGRGESMADTARALSQYADVIMARVYKHAELEELARSGTVPVINGMSDREHPCQALADVMTMREKGKKEVAIVGDPQTSTANSLMLACAKAGIAVRMVCPRGYAPRKDYLEEAEKAAKAGGAGGKGATGGAGGVRVFHSIEEGVAGADVIYVAAWKPGGAGEQGEDEQEEKTKAFLPFQVNANVVGKAKKDCIVMHPLPARRGVEITGEVLDGRHSVVWEQAANRLHVQKAVLVHLLGKEKS